MADKLHDVVKLLLARMESHPEEFARGASRWWMIENVLDNCSKEEAEALHAGLRPIRLQELHEDVMDELLNGPDRRVNEQSMGASLRAAPHPTKKIAMTQAEMNLINKLTETSTLAEKDQFIREYAKSKREMQK